MSKLPLTAITMSTEDSITAFTVKASLVKHLHQQNQDLLAQQQQQQQQQSELKTAHNTTQARI